jgi:putative transposase
VKDVMAQRSITVSYKAIRLWCNKVCSRYSKRLGRKHQGYGDTLFIDAVSSKIHRKQIYPWRAVHLNGKVPDVFLQKIRAEKTKNVSLRGYCANTEAS